MFGNNIKEMGLGLILKKEGTTYIGKVAGKDMDTVLWTMYVSDYLIVPRTDECPLFVEGVLQKDAIASFYQKHESQAIKKQTEIDSSRSDDDVEYILIVK